MDASSIHANTRDNLSVVDVRAHWDRMYREREPTAVSWFEPSPENSMALIEEAGIGSGAPIIDVGGGASTLCECLLHRGYTNVTVADISPAALAHSREQAGSHRDDITWIEAD